MIISCFRHAESKNWTAFGNAVAARSQEMQFPSLKIWKDAGIRWLVTLLDCHLTSSLRNMSLAITQHCLRLLELDGVSSVKPSILFSFDGGKSRSDLWRLVGEHSGYITRVGL